MYCMMCGSVVYEGDRFCAFCGAFQEAEPPAQKFFSAPKEPKRETTSSSLNYPMALNPGSVLAGQYIIQKTVGQGGFGITYIAKDHQRQKLVALKEYFPETVATRERAAVIPISHSREENFEYGRRHFLQEAKTLSNFIGNENIVRIYSYFEENNTAYFVMEYIDGIDLSDYIKKNGGKITFEDAGHILFPVMDALSVVHKKGIIHRDISPENILITRQGQAKLIDFGAARYSMGNKSMSLDIILRHGIAPKEQYSRHSRQGPYTDVYALAATFYYAITGVKPPESIDRLEEDRLVKPSALGIRISPSAEKALLGALEVLPEKRYQSMEEFKSAMLNALQSYR